MPMRHLTVRGKGSARGPQRKKHWAAVSGAALIFALSSGLAVGCGAAVERLATTGMTPETSPARPVLPLEVNLLRADPAGYIDDDVSSACDRGACSGIKQWFPAGAPIPTTEVAPNEPRLFGGHPTGHRSGVRIYRRTENPDDSTTSHQRAGHGQS
jgi:hypothetical protein